MTRIVGLGTDLVSIARFEAALDRHGERLLARVFTGQEVADSRARPRPAESLAARFAAKEACFKALGAGWPNLGIRYQDVEVRREESGAPRLALAGRLGAIAGTRGVRACHVSLSHTGEAALAVVVLEGGEG